MGWDLKTLEPKKGKNEARTNNDTDNVYSITK